MEAMADETRQEAIARAEMVLGCATQRRTHADGRTADRRAERRSHWTTGGGARRALRASTATKSHPSMTQFDVMLIPPTCVLCGAEIPRGERSMNVWVHRDPDGVPTSEVEAMARVYDPALSTVTIGGHTSVAEQLEAVQIGYPPMPERVLMDPLDFIRLQADRPEAVVDSTMLVMPGGVVVEKSTLALPGVPRVIYTRESHTIARGIAVLIARLCGGCATPDVYGGGER